MVIAEARGFSPTVPQVDEFITGWRTYLADVFHPESHFEQYDGEDPRIHLLNMLIEEKVFLSAAASQPGDTEETRKQLIAESKMLLGVRRWGLDGFKKNPTAEEEQRYQNEGNILYEELEARQQPFKPKRSGSFNLY